MCIGGRGQGIISVRSPSHLTLSIFTAQSASQYSAHALHQINYLLKRIFIHSVSRSNQIQRKCIQQMLLTGNWLSLVGSFVMNSLTHHESTWNNLKDQEGEPLQKEENVRTLQWYRYIFFSILVRVWVEEGGSYCNRVMVCLSFCLSYSFYFFGDCWDRETETERQSSPSSHFSLTVYSLHTLCVYTRVEDRVYALTSINGHLQRQECQLPPIFLIFLLLTVHRNKTTSCLGSHLAISHDLYISFFFFTQPFIITFSPSFCFPLPWRKNKKRFVFNHQDT